MGRANYISANGCSVPCEILHAFSISSQGLQKLGHKVWGWTHWGNTVCTEARSRLPPYGSTSRSGKKIILKKITFLIPLVSPLKHNWACCTVKEKHKCVRQIGAMELSISASSSRDRFKMLVLRPAVTRYGSWGEPRGTSEKHLLAIFLLFLMKCYCPLRLSPCSAAQVQLLLHPRKGFCARVWYDQWLLCLLEVILHCCTIHRNG